MIVLLNTCKVMNSIHPSNQIYLNNSAVRSSVNNCESTQVSSFHSVDKGLKRKLDETDLEILNLAKFPRLETGQPEISQRALEDFLDYLQVETTLQDYALFIAENPINSYEGSWKGEKKNGRGIEKSEKGLVLYNGYFRSHQRHGQGTLFYHHQKFYEGNFREGKMHGNGKIFDKNGQIVYEGQFIDNAAQGSGKFFLKGTLVYSGKFFQNLFEGEGNLYYPNGQIKHEGVFKKGLPHGDGVSYDEKGIMLYKGVFKKGKSNPYPNFKITLKNPTETPVFPLPKLVGISPSTHPSSFSY